VPSAGFEPSGRVAADPRLRPLGPSSNHKALTGEHSPRLFAGPFHNTMLTLIPSVTDTFLRLRK
jgi:hypothetical protein